jgi:hypothetical protein
MSKELKQDEIADFTSKQEPAPNVDSLANKEDTSLKTGDDLKQKAIHAKHRRDQRWKFTLHWIYIVAVGAVFTIFILAVCIWSWHLLTPTFMHFLDNEQITKVQTILFSVLASSVFQTRAQKLISKGDEE